MTTHPLPIEQIRLPVHRPRWRTWPIVNSPAHFNRPKPGMRETINRPERVTTLFNVAFFDIGATALIDAVQYCEFDEDDGLGG